MKKRISPSLFLFLLVAALLWYGNKLGQHFTTEIVVPIQIENDYESKLWIEQPLLKVRCSVEGVGSKLLAYSLGVAEPLSIPMSQLIGGVAPLNGLESAESDTLHKYYIDAQNLTAALSSAAKEIRILQAISDNIAIEAWPMRSRRMAINSHIEVTPARQYIQVGTTELLPCSVTVRAPMRLLDSLGAISTTKREIFNLKGSSAGRIALESHPGIVLSEQQVGYNVKTSPYTQQVIELPIRAVHVPEGFSCLIVPAQASVVVNVPLESYEQIRPERLHATIDYGTQRDNQNGLCIVRVDSLPRGAEVIRIEPQAAEPFLVKR